MVGLVVVMADDAARIERLEAELRQREAELREAQVVCGRLLKK
jgi:hypothetical protein